MEESETKMSYSVDVALRLPGVVMLEMLYMETISFKNLTYVFGSSYYLLDWNVDVMLYILAWLLILLPQKSLTYLYSCVISFASVILSHYILRRLFIRTNIFENESTSTFHLVISSNNTLKKMKWAHVMVAEREIFETSVTVILLQLMLVLLSCRIINAKPKALFLLSSPLYPWLTCMFTSTTLGEMMSFCYFLSVVAVIVYYLKPLNIFTMQWKLKVFWIKVQLIIRIFGWRGIVTWAVDKYQVQRLLITCWVLRYTVQLLANLYGTIDLNKLDQTIFDNMDMNILNLSSGFSVTLLLFFTGIQCLTTTINLFGLVCIIKDIVRVQFFLARSWLHWSFRDHPPDAVTGPLTGFIDGITLLIMTLYTDALNTYVEDRMVLMIYILFTIASSQFQSMFSIVDPILMTLATAHNGSFWKHLRTVILALFLLLICGVLSYISFFVMRPSFWVFIVAYNYVNTFSLTLGSLSIYFILMFDYLTLRGWTSLDDVMFYIRGACRALEFCVTLCMCGYIMMTFYGEMTSITGIVMLAVYTYYCIVQRGGKGWRIWQMRRQAGFKVRSLPLASEETLKSKQDDLCPICYQPMESDVRIMHCNHLFHENCLKKWFYIQDKCPMCYAEFKATAVKQNSSSENPQSKLSSRPNTADSVQPDNVVDHEHST